MKIARTVLTVLAAGALALAPAAHAAPSGSSGSAGPALPDLPGLPDSSSALTLPDLPDVPGSGTTGPSVPGLPSPADIPGMVDDALSDLGRLPGQLTPQLPQVPGGDRATSTAPASPSTSPVPRPAPADTGCSAQAKACVDLSAQTAWLQSGGRVTRGPVPVSTGRPGYATPAGLTRVTRKVKDEWSRPYNAPMPYSVYFSAGTGYPSDIGIAFHEGDPGVLSHGCVHLNHDDAVAFFTTLGVGDYVDVVN